MVAEPTAHRDLIECLPSQGSAVEAIYFPVRAFAIIPPGVS